MEKYLIEARLLAEKINLAQAEGRVPDDHDTVRLCLIMAILASHLEDE